MFQRIIIKAKKILLKRSSNYPYISGDSIADCTDYYVFGRDGREPVKVDRLRRAHSIFVPGDKFHFLLNNYFEEINAKTIVTGNSDENFTKKILLPRSVSLWICQNNAVANDTRTFPLPIGIENKRLGRAGFKKFHTPPASHKISDKVLLPPMSPTNPIRKIVSEWAEIHPEIFERKLQYLTPKKYFKLTKDFKFIFCAEGNGFENHRIWEALYQNSFPVMLESSWSQTLKILNLPILYIKELNELNSVLLKNFAQEHFEFDCRNTPQLWVDFWEELISTGSS